LSGKNITPNWQTTTSKGRVVEGQLHRVGLPPLHRTLRAQTRRMIEHRLVQVGGDDRRVGRQ
jgi:hypothetical protein